MRYCEGMYEPESVTATIGIDFKVSRAHARLCGELIRHPVSARYGVLMRAPAGQDALGTGQAHPRDAL